MIVPFISMIIAPDEFDGPGVMWRNDKECDPNVHNTNITVSADFFCPVKKECIHVHRCSFAGEGTPVTEANTNTNQDIKTVKAGYFEHVFEPETVETMTMDDKTLHSRSCMMDFMAINGCQLGINT